MVAVEQGALLGITGRDVKTHQSITLEQIQHVRVIQHLVLDDFAADAPVGVPIQQQGLTRGLCFGQCGIQLLRGADGLPLSCYGFGTAIDGRGRLDCQRLEWIALPAQGAVPTEEGIYQQEKAQQLGQTLAW